MARPELVVDDRPGGAGGPELATLPAPRVGKKEARQLRKHAADQARLLRGWEQYRALWDGIDFKRQLINMGDKKVRFALLIMGAINALVLLVVTRGRVLDAIPAGLRPWMASLLVLYGVVAFGLVAHAIEALRPRPEAKVRDQAEWETREESDSGPVRAGRPGLMIRGPDLTLTFAAEQELWRGARVAEVNAELILFNRTSSVILMRQLVALQKLYQGLKVLALLAAVILSILMGGTVLGGA